MIKHLKNREIDRQRWDECIVRSPNGIVYAWSWYLDVVSKGWEALVKGDYESVFPLTIGKKWGIKYLKQPYFAQQLGLFSVYPVTEILLNEFLQRISGKFSSIDIYLNKKNHPVEAGFQIRQRITHHLELKSPYEKLFSNYSETLKQKLKKASGSGLKPKEDIDPDEVITLFRKTAALKDPSMGDAACELLYRLILEGIKKKSVKITAAYTPRNVLCAASVYFISHQKACMIINASTEEGKSLGGSAFVIDRFIHLFAGSGLTLDFEGSNHKGIAAFFKTFGSTPVYYPHISKKFLSWR